ncbi:MAG: aminopeptidase N [Alphaproteobacteria bacterium]|nr:aminopeptidase N [Alphaproteobacteria bacterium]
MKTDTPRPIRLEEYQPPEFLIDHVDLDISLHPTNTIVRARLKVRPNPNNKRKPGPLRLSGEHLALESLKLNGKELPPGAFSVSKSALTISKPPDGSFKIAITTRVNPDANKALQGIYRSRGVYCTQCEAEGFRRITYFLDRPDILSTYKVRIEADRNDVPVLLANGNPLERGTLAGGRRHYAVWVDPHPKPCYLFAMVGGDLGSMASSFTTMSGREVALTIYVEHGKEARAAWAMDCLKRSMRWDEVNYGREYDLEVFNIVAVSDFNMGAMENKGLNIFNDRLILASANTATDAMYEAIESVVAHEYFHNWTGNRITCRDWFQLCLKEGLTVFRDQEFSGDERSAVVQRICDVRQLRAVQFPEDAGPLAHPVRPRSYIEINNFYTATVYEKGAEIVRMLQTIIGKEDFRAGMDLYFERHDGEASTIEEFLACFAEVSGRDLGQFALWYEQAGTPRVKVAFEFDSRSQTARLTFEQSVPATPGQPTKEPMHIPIRLGLVGREGDDVALEANDRAEFADGLMHLTKRRQTISFKGISGRPVPSILRGFSAPVNFEFDMSEADLAFLLANDSDPFNRWQAANTYATRVLVKRVESIAAGGASRRGEGLARALSKAIEDDDLDWAFRAELLQLPTQNDIAREIGRNVNPDHIQSAHRALSALLARRLAVELTQMHSSLVGRGRFSPNAKSAGRRAARNAALTLLMARGLPEDITRAGDHYFKARTMTEAAHAMTLLAKSGAGKREEVLADFYDRWRGDHVVIDTWFAAQAQSPRANVISQMERLMTLEEFDRTAPNKLRALIGSFIMRNPVQFNRADGQGYEFVVDKLLEVDQFNPQIAARLLNGLRSWRTLESKRRRAAKRALERLAAAPSISRDISEIVSRILQD